VQAEARAQMTGERLAACKNMEFFVDSSLGGRSAPWQECREFPPSAVNMSVTVRTGEDMLPHLQ
jgi:hypothetical protein